MLTAFSTAEHATLMDNNRLMHLWDLSSTDSHRLRYQPGEGIEVHGDDEVSYVEDLLALSVHCEDLVKVFHKALKNLHNRVPATLQNLYMIGQQYQGLRSLLVKIIPIFTHTYQTVAERALHTTSSGHHHTVLRAATELNHSILALCDLQLTIAGRQRIFLTETSFIYGIVTNEDGQFQNGFVTPTLRNRELTVATFQKEDTVFEFRGQLTANFAVPSRLDPTFTNITRFRLIQGYGIAPIKISIYPKWAKIDERGTLMTLPQFEKCPHGANDYVRSVTKDNLAGVLAYQAPTLAAMLSGPFANPENKDVLPFYFQAMVEIAKNHHCFQVELFIPFDFITHAYAFGFYSNETTEQELCKKAVELQLAHQRPISLLPSDTAQFQGNEQLLLPVYFPIGEINTRPVYFTEQGTTTTYGELCRQLALFKDAPTNSILPDAYGLLARPFCSAYEAMKKAQIDGKAIPRNVASYQQELTDSRWLTKERDLVSIGEATHIVPDQINKTARILR